MLHSAPRGQTPIHRGRSRCLFLKIMKTFPKGISIFLLVFYWQKLYHMSSPKQITGGGIELPWGLDQRFSTWCTSRHHVGASQGYIPELHPRESFNGPLALAFTFKSPRCFLMHSPGQKCWTNLQGKALKKQPEVHPEASPTGTGAASTQGVGPSLHIYMEQLCPPMDLTSSQFLTNYPGSLPRI